MSSAISFGMIPSSTASAIAFATADWAGPKIFAVSAPFFRVTFGTMSVDGFVGRFGLMTDRRGVWPAESCVMPVANAWPTGPFLSPIIRSTCANSEPVPIRASPILKNGISLTMVLPSV